MPASAKDTEFDPGQEFVGLLKALVSDGGFQRLRPKSYADYEALLTYYQLTSSFGRHTVLVPIVLEFPCKSDV
jgi:hypothetical protein